MNDIILFPERLKYRIFKKPVDMRCGFNKLGEKVFTHLGKHGHDERIIFFFFNRQRTAVKALYYTPRMMTILHGKLIRDEFMLPGFDESQSTIDLSPVTMNKLLSGLNVLSTRCA